MNIKHLKEAKSVSFRVKAGDVKRLKCILSDRVPYATTISVISSGLVKLSQLQRAYPLFRGVGKNNANTLPPQ